MLISVMSAFVMSAAPDSANTVVITEPQQIIDGVQHRIHKLLL